MSGSFALFARAFAIGVAVAAPIGAMGVLCIRRTLEDGWRAGVATGLGVATADGFYAACAAFGLTAVTDVLVRHQMTLRLVGAVALAYLGVRALRSHPESCEPARAVVRGSAGLYTSAVALTLTNPTTIVAFAAVFTGAGLITGASPVDAIRATAGVASGSFVWWLFLTGVLAALRERVDARFLVTVNRVSGLALLGFGFAIAGAVVLG